MVYKCAETPYLFSMTELPIYKNIYRVRIKISLGLHTFL